MPKLQIREEIHIQIFAEVVLNPYEHDAYQWIDYEEAENYLEFDNQIENIMKIHKRFIEREPTRFLEIDLKEYL